MREGGPVGTGLGQFGGQARGGRGECLGPLPYSRLRRLALFLLRLEVLRLDDAVIGTGGEFLRLDVTCRRVGVLGLLDCRGGRVRRLLGQLRGRRGASPGILRLLGLRGGLTTRFGRLGGQLTHGGLFLVAGACHELADGQELMDVVGGAP
ncbi:hypothetical protein [Streptomyces turgidiscabies]|uniref:Uncharacterized protein n=1 Tax=Streptomyces turgidiscabies TaxID=85558 RepID=A0ABU0RMN9_9ACTN|nr:hypothetical protein [Streptomyces turgidiscabies]MDQ0933263.1 hypothetical protein [Streptomyces turgidiscabies]